MKACGVVVAKVLGHNWMPIPSKGSGVNVGTIPVLPSDRRNPRRRERLGARPADRVGVGGGPVVVRGRESRSHGEGVQCDRRIDKQ